MGMPMQLHPPELKRALTGHPSGGEGDNERAVMKKETVSSFRILVLLPVLCVFLAQCCLPHGAVWDSGKRDTSGTS
jgi:hypothetical protein